MGLNNRPIFLSAVAEIAEEIVEEIAEIVAEIAGRETLDCFAGRRPEIGFCRCAQSNGLFIHVKSTEMGLYLPIFIYLYLPC